jgi:hypothetical protein
MYEEYDGGEISEDETLNKGDFVIFAVTFAAITIFIFFMAHIVMHLF